MPTAPAADQRRLLDVQDADTRAAQAQYRRDTLPVIAQITELTGRALDLDEERVARGTEVSDLRREVTKAEDDVQSVRTRAERDEARLASGEGSPKDLQALQSELEVLGRRQAELEDIELEIMERLETAESAHAAAVSQHDAITAQVRDLEAERDSAIAQIDIELAEISKERDAAAAGIDESLLAAYEKLRIQYDGIGAAALVGATCQGCHMTLNPTDMARIDATAPDTLVRCEECGRILVREGTA